MRWYCSISAEGHDQILIMTFKTEWETVKCKSHLQQDVVRVYRSTGNIVILILKDCKVILDRYIDTGAQMRSIRDRRSSCLCGMETL